MASRDSLNFTLKYLARRKTVKRKTKTSAVTTIGTTIATMLMAKDDEVVAYLSCR
jgi:hypothetical protein